MGAEPLKYHQVDDYIMDYIKHTYCINTKCRTSPCAQHHSGHGPRGYICEDCFGQYRKEYDAMKAEAQISRDRKERDLRKHYAEKVNNGFALEKPLERVLWDGDAELRRWKIEEKKRIEEGKEKEPHVWSGFDMKERFQGMFLPFYVGIEDDEWLLVEEKESGASNGWNDL